MLRLRPLRALRAALVLAVGLGLLGTTLGPLPAATAAEPTGNVARLQLVVKEIEILDDREGTFSGQAELNFHVSIWACPEWVPAPCDGHRAVSGIAFAYERLYGNTGDKLKLDRVVPQAGDHTYGSGDVAERGIPVFPGYRYVIEFGMNEDDGHHSKSEEMGIARHFLSTGEHGLTIGTHLGRPTGASGGHVGDYLVTYEIRRTPLLPDLRVSQIDVQDLPGSTKKRVCTGVQNVESGDSGPFELAVRVDHVVPPGGRAAEANMAPGTGRLICVDVDVPPGGERFISATVDEPRGVIEYDETNNVLERTYRAVGSVAVASPVPGGNQPDLTVSGIKLNGQAPDGKEDCKDGKSSVTVTVKNDGVGKAGAFVVRLTVDGDDGQAKGRQVGDIDAGQEREVRFDDVRLKQGERRLSVEVDARQAVAESDEANNERTVTARCKNAD